MDIDAYLDAFQAELKRPKRPVFGGPPAAGGVGPSKPLYMAAGPIRRGSTSQRPQTSRTIEQQQAIQDVHSGKNVFMTQEERVKAIFTDLKEIAQTNEEVAEGLRKIVNESKFNEQLAIKENATGIATLLSLGNAKRASKVMLLTAAVNVLGDDRSVLRSIATTFFGQESYFV
ncbi:Oidioi.mRNA.OKI2018_I69.PAR.g9855.t1.cds [Oikopleura dioica]|uniref:Oidioi.mRNA.OKI2018_I69.PAR.g9855.t1.cds n=1 Tax=Oikopleura dioica TaxID=34765 RepID=A0ABN7RS05_OIKDI|nr:Oidioi.mRNA.OKI2018_I69.PAR.g9855.t1.cds [Oikopleura dioica]